eukprot:GFUD01020244.1.p1 GENE.GFUD01020244.1~~GFUD01020244.1.p1  ORF type:complete len:206 (+),score=53.80 GFUD01020244.1:89-706(+)
MNWKVFGREKMQKLMQSRLELHGGIGDEAVMNTLNELDHGAINHPPVNEVVDTKDYGVEHDEADAVITSYINDGDKAFRELVQMLERSEPKMEARMIKPFDPENSEAKWLESAIMCLSMMAVILIIVILTVLVKRRIQSKYNISEDKRLFENSEGKNLQNHNPRIIISNSSDLSPPSNQESGREREVIVEMGGRTVLWEGQTLNT